MSTLTLTIDDLGAQGDGIAHDKNDTIFVAGALPGETVRVELATTKNMVKRAELLEILTPSPRRVKPPCPHFPRCGGCRFQHIDDEGYAAAKLADLKQLFLKERLSVPDIRPAIVTAAHTRRRARLAAKRGKEAKAAVTLGFNEWRSHEIVNVEKCPVLLPALEAFIASLREALPAWLPPGGTCDVQLTLLPGGLDVVLIGGPALNLQTRQALGALASALDIAHLSWRKWDRSPIEPIAFRHELSVKSGEITLPFPPGSFLQATGMGEKALTDFACEAAGAGIKALDLFCGLGAFGLSLPQPQQVHFADLDGPAVETLEKAAKRNPHYEVSLRNLAVDPFTAGECGAFDLAIFDPPRGGAKAQAAQLAQSDVPAIVAISCDPPSFARDAKILMEGGYSLKALQPVDQFLWSPHMELAAHFIR